MRFHLKQRFFSTSVKRVAITGSTGIIGSRIYGALQEKGWECVGIASGKVAFSFLFLLFLQNV
jgi:nucleoside-diphosphate-sugar epimerase